MPTDLPMLEARIRRLERLVHGLAAALLLSSVLLLVAARPTPQAADVLQAKRFQLVDEEGKVRMDLRHDSTETGLFVLDAVGDTRVGIAQFAHGGGGVALHGPSTRGAAVLYLKERGSLTLYDTTGAVTARFPATTP